MFKVAAIVAMDEGRLIGSDNAIPWHYPEDMKRFAELTMGHTVLMGRKTYQSLPAKYRPLPKRLNVVAGRTLNTDDYPPEVVLCHDLISYVQGVKDGKIAIQGEYLWIIGGAQIYQQALPFCDELFLTLIAGRHQGDAFFPQFEEHFTQVESKKVNDELTFIKYTAA